MTSLYLLARPPPSPFQALAGVPMDERCTCKPRSLAEAAQRAAALKKK